MAKKNYRKMRAPDKAEYKYIIFEGEIFINVEADENPRFIAKIYPWPELWKENRKETLTK